MIVRMRYGSWVALCAVLLLSACGPEAEEETGGIRSVLTGRFTVSAEVDTVRNFAGFEVLVARQEGGETDTLGFATTDSSGAFAMTVNAPERAVYPLVISRRGEVLRVSELAVAPGDTARVEAEFPLGGRLLRIRSPENAAWMAYRNTRAQYNQALARLLQAGEADQEALAQSVGQTSTVLWSLRQSFPNTIGADVAAAESVVMLEGWNDSLLVSRAREIDAESPGFVDAARAARRAQARLAGQDAALALLREFQEASDDPEVDAALQSEIVVAHMDSLHRAEAIEAARVLQEQYAESGWADWAGRAVYEIENLAPGMAAPEFLVVNEQGRTVTLDKLEGRLVLLEFYRPEDPTFLRQLDARNALYEAADNQLAVVSVSVQPDSLLNEAFREGRPFPGIHVIAPAGMESEVARNYNVSVLPTRVLIDREGRIVRKYVGDSILPLQEEVLTRLADPAPPPS